MEAEFTGAEKKLLMRLWPNRKEWYRSLVLEISRRRLEKSLRNLERRGYIARDEARSWAKGRKKFIELTDQGRRAASRLLIAGKGGKLFIQILEDLEAISKLPSDKGEKVAELALDIVNVLDTEEKSEKVRDVLSHLIKQLKE